MTIISYNQPGYVDSSMSERARSAYNNGEMPKSKWTKKAMLAAIDDYLADNDMVCLVNYTKLRKDVIFDQFFRWSSWHHTGKFANETDFYSLDEKALDVISSGPDDNRSLVERNLRTRDRVAQLGCALDQLVDDPNWCVRREVAYQGFGLDKLVNDPELLVRIAAKEAAAQQSQNRQAYNLASSTKETCASATELGNNREQINIEHEYISDSGRGIGRY